MGVFSAIGTQIIKILADLLKNREEIILVIIISGLFISSVLFLFFNKLLALVSVNILSILFGFIGPLGNSILLRYSDSSF
jgi:hypothetical protein